MSSAAEEAPSPSSPGEPTKCPCGGVVKLHVHKRGMMMRMLMRVSLRKMLKNSYKQSAEVIMHYLLLIYLSHGQALAQKTDD